MQPVINKAQNFNVLFVDDDKFSLQATERVLSKEKFNKFFATNAHEALEIIRSQPVHILVSDMKMPGVDGLALLKIVKEQFPDIIRLVYSAYTQPSQILPCINHGEIYRYVTKPTNPEELISAIDSAIEVAISKKNQQELADQLYSKNQELQKTLAEKEASEDHLKQLTIIDELTHVYNRRHFNACLQREFNYSQRYQTDFSLLMMDLDHFKRVNDTFGHTFGDFVLKTFAKRIRTAMREIDILFRYGGEEFIVLLPNTAIIDAVQLGDRILQTSRVKPFIMNDYSCTCTVSIGAVSYATSNPIEPKDIVESADELLYHAKRQGRDQLAAAAPPPSTLACINTQPA